MKLKVGLISIGFQNFRTDIAKEYLGETADYLETLDNVELFYKKDVFMNEDDILEELDYFNTNQVDLLVCQVGTFTMGANVVNIIKKMQHTPLFLCGFRDPIVEDYNTIPLNSLTGFNMFTSFLKKFNKKFSYVYGTVKEEKFFSKMQTTIDALYVKKELDKAKFCVIGSRVPGFYLSEVDQLKFREVVGPRISYWSVGQVVEAAKKIDQTRVDEEIKTFMNVKITTTSEMLEKNVRIYLAVRDYKEANNISAFSIKCWPEFQELYNTAVCFVLSKLTDSGIMASCEGDITGLATMYMQHVLSNKIPFFTDLVNISQSGSIKAWHCGQGPESLADSDVEYCEHPTMKSGLGTSVQYTMKTGDLNMSKLSEGSGDYKLFNLKGHSVEVDRELMGTQTDIVFDKNIDEILDTIVEEGIEHHYSIIHDDLTDTLIEWCKWSNIKYLG